MTQIYVHLMDDLVVATSTTPNQDCTVPAPPEVQCGWTRNGESWWPPATPTPQAISPRQLRLWLHSEGLLEAVPALIAQLPAPARAEAEIEWEYASEFRLDHPLVAQCAQALGLDADALSAAWRASSAL